jgi:hypothetical protein
VSETFLVIAVAVVVVLVFGGVVGVATRRRKPTSDKDT